MRAIEARHLCAILWGSNAREKDRSRLHRAHASAPHGEAARGSRLVELKFDGYRALAIKDGGKVRLRSRNNTDFTSRYPAIVKALSATPDETVIDGEIVALERQRQHREGKNAIA